MTENATNQRLLETLKAIQAKLSHMSREILDLKADVRGMKGHMAAFLQSEVARNGLIALIQLKIERIEKRLDLADR